MSTEDEFLKALRATFSLEAAEHLQAIESGLVSLEQSPAPDVQRDLVETVFRAAHSLKGAARAVDFTEIESRCQLLEDTFADWKKQQTAPTSDAIDAVHRALDAMNAAMAGQPDAAAEPKSESAPRSTQPRMMVPLPEPIAGDTVRIAVAKLDAQLLDAEELLTAKLTARQRAQDLRYLAGRFSAWRKEWMSVEPDAHALRRAVKDGATPGFSRVLEFLNWNLDHVTSLEGDVAALTKTAERDHQAIGKLVDDLLEDSKHLLLLPFATLAAPFSKLVRDLCRDQGKEADLVVHGEDVEIDKRILEELKAPLIHLLRNSVDHGVETPDARQMAGKPPRATITLAASRVEGHKVEFLVADDGAGIALDKVKAAAVKRGLLSNDEARQLGDEPAQRLIFETDVSTSPMITDLSGRGLGLAIVREKADKLGGSVLVSSRPGQGTDFAIVVPSTLATFRGILVEAAERLFVVPTIHVERVIRVKAGEIRSVEGRDTISVSERAVALVRLADVLNLPQREAFAEPRATTVALVLGTGDQRIAFVVDAARDEQEVLVKPLGKPLSRVRNIAGATVLASGQVAPILNVSDLLKSARKTGVATRAAAASRPADAKAKSVLVAEDSITSRMLIKGILESAGYKVKTAVNGMDAFTLLRAEPFDLLVSDVEMPRLNGFDLTARIRADKKLAELPVVLVTALESPEDRERGIDVGASAYIVKSKFDQSNLLDAVRRLA